MNAVLEMAVRLVGELDAGQRFLEGGLRRLRVHLEKLIGHPGVADVEIGPQRPHHVEHSRDAADEGEVDRLDLRPERKVVVGDNKHVGVAHRLSKELSAGLRIPVLSMGFLQ